MARLPQDTPARPMGWREVKQLYLSKVPMKEISRLSGFAVQSIGRHVKAQRWDVERESVMQRVKEEVFELYGKDAQVQAAELLNIHGQIVEVVKEEVTKLRLKKTPSSKRLRALNQLEAVMATATQAMRLLIGSATERKEIHTLAEWVVEVDASMREVKDVAPSPRNFPTVEMPEKPALLPQGSADDAH